LFQEKEGISKYATDDADEAAREQTSDRNAYYSEVENLHDGCGLPFTIPLITQPA
jgi:hypothetical protein